jgi:hypothetical protein
LSWLRRASLQIATVVVLTAVMGWSGVWILSRVLNWAQPLAVFSGHEEAVFNNPRLPGGQVYGWIKSNVRPKAKFLTFRQAELAYYFPEMKWDYDFSPALAPAYTTIDTVEGLFDFYKSRGIEYVLIPGYYPSTYYNSLAGELLGDPSYTQELAQDWNYRLFRLRDTTGTLSCSASLLKDDFFYRSETISEELEMSLSAQPGMEGGHYTELGGDEPGEVNGIRISSGGGEATSLLLAKRRRESTVFATSPEPLYVPGGMHRPTDADYVVVDSDAHGLGFLAVHLAEYDRDGVRRSRLIWDGVVGSGTRPTTPIKAFARLRPDTFVARLLLRWDKGAAFAGAIDFKRACFARMTNAIDPDAELPAEQPAGTPPGSELLTNSLAWSPGDGKPLDVRLGTTFGEGSTSSGLGLTSWYEEMDGRRAQVIAVPRGGYSEATLEVGALFNPGTSVMTGSLKTSGFFDPYRLMFEEFLGGWALRILQNANTGSTLARIARFTQDWFLTAPEEPKLITVEMRGVSGKNLVVTPTLYWKSAEGRLHATPLQSRMAGFDTTPDRWEWSTEVGGSIEDVVLKFRLDSVDRSRLPLLKIRSVDIRY